MQSELKPCPFCGAPDIDPDAEDDNGRFYVCCMNCWATASHYETKADAIAAWNTRASDAEITRRFGKGQT